MSDQKWQEITLPAHVKRKVAVAAAMEGTSESAKIAELVEKFVADPAAALALPTVPPKMLRRARFRADPEVWLKARIAAASAGVPVAEPIRSLANLLDPEQTV